MISGFIDSTYIATSSGLRRISEITEMDTVYTGKSGASSASAKLIESVKFKHVNNSDTSLVSLEDGSSFTASQNHRILSLTKSGNTTWKRLSDLHPGMAVIKRIGTGTLTRNYIILDGVKITENLAYFLGYYFGRGFVSADGKNLLGWIVDNRKNELKTKLLRIAQELFPSASINVTNLPGENLFVLEGIQIYHFLVRHGFCLTGDSFEFPSAILASPASVIGAFVSGFRDAGQSPFDLTSCSGKFIKVLAILLISMGIDSKVFHLPGDNDNSVHVASVLNEYRSKFNKLTNNHYIYHIRDTKDIPVVIKALHYAGKQDVVDLTVNITPSYIANGFIVHNHDMT